MTDSTPCSDPLTPNQRVATVARNTLETKISVSLNLDGAGKGVFNTGVPFLEHMMDQIARHGMIDLDVTCDGDTYIDDHHSVEDIGITIGTASLQGLNCLWCLATHLAQSSCCRCAHRWGWIGRCSQGIWWWLTPTGGARRCGRRPAFLMAWWV